MNAKKILMTFIYLLEHILYFKTSWDSCTQQYHVDASWHTVNLFISSTESSKDIVSDETWSIVLIAGLAAGVVGTLLLCLLAVLMWRRRRRRTRAENTFNRVPVRIINPSKKNSLNRRNDLGAAMRLEKLRMLEKGVEEEEDDEIDLMLEKCNFTNARNLGWRDELLKGELRTFSFLFLES